VRLYGANWPNNSTKLDERSDAKQWVSDVKFSTGGHTLVVGAHDCKIYIYAVDRTTSADGSSNTSAPNTALTSTTRSRGGEVGGGLNSTGTVTGSGSSSNGPTASLKLRCVFSKHNSVITHMDLSLDGHFMQSNCAAYELLFSDIHTGRQITSASELKDVKWETWTCPLGER
jgi:WD40 repeat protein